MARIAGVIPNDKRVVISLTYVYESSGLATSQGGMVSEDIRVRDLRSERCYPIVARMQLKLKVTFVVK